MSEPNSQDHEQQIAQLNDAVAKLTTRVETLEAKLRQDHKILREDHKKIANLEETGKINVRPIGL